MVHEFGIYITSIFHASREGDPLFAIHEILVIPFSAKNTYCATCALVSTIPRGSTITPLPDMGIPSGRVQMILMSAARDKEIIFSDERGELE